MSSVEFEEDKDIAILERPGVEQYQSGIAGVLMKRGIAKTPGQANAVMVGFMLFMFLASAAVLFSSPPVRAAIFPKMNTVRYPATQSPQSSQFPMLEE